MESLLSGRNLLVSLHKWAIRQDENFITEAFAHLLRHLRDSEPEVAIRVLANLTDGHLSLPTERLRDLHIGTQNTTDQRKRPDITLLIPNDFLIYVEAKVESPPDWGQLSNYRDELKRSGVYNTALIFLTRYPAGPAPAGLSLDAVRRWYEVVDWLDKELNERAIRGEVSVYLTEQFIGLLKTRNIAMDKVGSELSGGVQACANLMKLVREVVCSAHLAPTSSKGMEEEFYLGYGIKGKQWEGVWIGLSDRNWNALRFSVHPVTEDWPVRAGFGWIEPYYHASNGIIWCDELPFVSEQADFFALTKGEQQAQVEQFLRKCLDCVHGIRGTNIIGGPTGPGLAEPV